MKVRFFLCSAAAIVALSAPAWAVTQTVTGQVTVDGTVAAFCTVAGTTQNGGVWGSLALGELADPTTGKLKTGLNTGTDLATPVLASVICNSAQPKIMMTATRMTISGAGAAPLNYSNQIDYVAHLKANLANSTVFDETYNTTGAGAQLPANGLLGSPLSTSTNNLTINVSNLSAIGNGVLVAATSPGYQGIINITITPS